jgi:hypothetical protein
MKHKIVWTTLVVLLVFILRASGALAEGSLSASSTAAQVTLGTAFTYQGQLRLNGALIENLCDLQFRLFDSADSGIQVGTTQEKTNVNINDGLFTVLLDFGANVFTGDARWLEISVRCPGGSGNFSLLSPRQALTAAPYALGLAPGTLVNGTNSSAVLVGYDNNLLKTYGLYGAAELGLYGAGSTIGVYGTGPTGVQGNSSSGNGVQGVSVLAGGQLDVGYAEGENNQAGGIGVRGTGMGDSGAGVSGIGGASYGVTGSSVAAAGVYGAGPTGVIGSGTATGIDGSSSSGNGVEGRGGNIGVYAHNNTVNGNDAYLASQCCAGDFNGDVVVHGNLTVEGVKTGYVADFSLNTDEDTFAPGDVVVVIGVADPLVGDIPVARVVRASVAYQTGVIGVVERHVTPGETPKLDDLPMTPGEYVSVVTLGMFHAVKVDATYGAIHAGDLLVASPHAGYAMKATDRSLAVGAIVGKALADLESGVGVVPILVTLQ